MSVLGDWPSTPVLYESRWDMRVEQVKQRLPYNTAAHDVWFSVLADDYDRVETRLDHMTLSELTRLSGQVTALQRALAKAMRPLDGVPSGGDL